MAAHTETIQSKTIKFDAANDRSVRTPAVPGGGFERPNPLIAGGPDLNALIRIRDRLAAHAGALAPTARWCVCPHLHQRRSFAPRSLRSVLAASQGPSKTLRILKPSLRKYTIEFSSRRARVSFELHDRRPIVAAIERAVLDPSPETYVVPQFSPDL